MALRGTVILNATVMGGTAGLMLSKDETSSLDFRVTPHP